MKLWIVIEPQDYSFATIEYAYSKEEAEDIKKNNALMSNNGEYIRIQEINV